MTQTQFCELKAALASFEREIAAKGGGFGNGTIRVWKGVRYQKIAPRKWRRLPSGKKERKGKTADENRLKEKALQIITNPTEKMQMIEFSPENFDRLFPRGMVKTPIGEIKLGEHQFERLAQKDKGARKRFLCAFYQTMTNPDVVIAEGDEKGGATGATLFIKGFASDNGNHYYVSITREFDKIKVAYSNGLRKKEQVEKKIKMSNSVRYIKATGGAGRTTDRLSRPTASTTGASANVDDIIADDAKNVKQNERRLQKAIANFKAWREMTIKAR